MDNALLAASLLLNLAVIGLLLFRRTDSGAAQLRSEIQQQFKLTRDELNARLESAGSAQLNLMTRLSEMQKRELSAALKTSSDAVTGRIGELSVLLKNDMRHNEERIDKLRERVEEQLRLLREDNRGQLEQMRATVDEKLQHTLETRLGESFKLVSDRLEQVHKGLGEMQTLATGVGDLKKVLTNVKTRGTWGEVQLGSLLEQTLTSEQYEANVVTRPGSADRVEYAIKLPSKSGDAPFIWLPIDSKFPLEDYQRLLEAQEAGDAALAAESVGKLEQRIKLEAKTITAKYIDPPHTTDFAVMFLPTEGLYAEVLRRPGLADTLQREYRVTPAGPTTLAALLNSLQMGFRTLAIEKRSSDVWQLLGAVKTEFGTFGGILDKTYKKLQEASNTIETASRKTRTIERKLRSVQELPSAEAGPLIGLAEPEEELV
ncbi:DNA recombination protein RmuC [Paenibacillus glufosinatiresistens]|uniref:DNA recombination protein RmuC n=1 Tax=Paenibacillus glufosinatiresistens TaxID=3070657 RepID=UPI00286E8DA7|nr:DNA recombination protein RmuC [Paenibacillus sp. YX.27]